MCVGPGPSVVAHTTCADVVVVQHMTGYMKIQLHAKPRL